MDEQQFLNACRLRKEGKAREAIREFLDLAGRTEDRVDRAGILWSAATTAMTLQDFGSARRIYKEVRALVPDLDTASLSGADPRLRSLLFGVVTDEADLSYVEGHKAEALSKLNRLLDAHGETLREPAFADAYRNLQVLRAFVLADTGDWRAALPILESAQAWEAPKNLIDFYLGHSYVCAYEYRKAKPLLIEALQLGLPANLEYRAHDALGITYFQLGGYAHAKLEFEKTIQAADSAYLRNSQIWKMLEVSCQRLGLEAEAKHYAAKARGATPGNLS